MRKIVFVYVVLVGLTIHSTAQTQTAVEKAPAAAAKEEAASPAPTPSLSEVETLKLENLQLKFVQAQQVVQQIQAQYRALAEEIAKAHPGYVLGQNNQLVPTPKTSPKAK